MSEKVCRGGVCVQGWICLGIQCGGMSTELDVPLDLEYLTGTNTWWCPPKHVRLASGHYALYWNVFCCRSISAAWNLTEMKCKFVVPNDYHML